MVDRPNRKAEGKQRETTNPGLSSDVMLYYTVVIVASRRAPEGNGADLTTQSLREPICFSNE